MPPIAIRPFRRSDRDQLTDLVNMHVEAVLPGVTVTATNRATNIGRTTVTSETGDYAITLLQIGMYDVRTELAGFTSQTSTITLSTGDRARVDVRLELGALAENVTVVAVNVLTTKAKEKRRGTRRGRIVGHTTPWRKAIVTLAPGQKIEFFEGV